MRPSSKDFLGPSISTDMEAAEEIRFGVVLLVVDLDEDGEAWLDPAVEEEEERCLVLRADDTEGDSEPPPT